MNNPAIRRRTPTVRAPNITVVELDDNGDGVVDRLGLSVLFGLAGGIDFRNKYLADNAYADANLFTFLEQAGLSIGGLPAGATTAALVRASVANTGSHELGHVMGLRHHDALGPVGTGVNGLGRVGNPASYTPAFPGPVEAFATNLHIMSSGAATGRPLDPTIERYFGVREMAKLATNEQIFARSAFPTARAATRSCSTSSPR